MSLTTGTIRRASLSTIRSCCPNKSAPEHTLPYSLAWKTKTDRWFLTSLKHLIYLGCSILMAQVTATTNLYAQGRLNDVCDDSVILSESDPEVKPTTLSRVAYSRSRKVHRPLIARHAGQDLIITSDPQTRPSRRKDVRVIRRNPDSDSNKPTTQVIDIAPSHTWMSSLVPTSTSSTSTTSWSVPSPFDVGFNHNITMTCQNFMTGMLENDIFKQCSPISMVLQMTYLLDTSCNVSVSVCTELLNSYAQNLTKSNACAPDLRHSNPQIEYALLGLRSYRTLYDASCLRPLSHSVHTNQSNSLHGTSHSIIPSMGNSKGSYCFANAITNTTNPTNSYVYFLPLNVSLVSTAVPTCNYCLQSTMSVFQQATANRSNVLAGNYVKAANQVNIVCGPEFVNASLVAAISSANIRGMPAPSLTIFWIWLSLTLMGWSL